MQSSSSSHYHPSGSYDDLRLPPIRNSGTYSSTPRTHASSRYVTPLEPPTNTSSSLYPRNPSLNLPPLLPPDQRPRSSLGHSSHAYGSTSLPPGSSSRHPSHPSHSHTLPPISSSYRPSSSHRRTNSLSVNTSDYDPPHTAYGHSSQSSHRSSGYHTSYGAASPTSISAHTSSSRTYACDLCGATFSRAYDCKRHRDIHTRQGGHECPYCHKSLSRADALKRHMERGCVGMEGIDDVDDDELEREQQRKERSAKRHSISTQAGGEGGGSKYYYTSVNTRHR